MNYKRVSSLVSFIHVLHLAMIKEKEEAFKSKLTLKKKSHPVSAKYTGHVFLTKVLEILHTPQV